MTTEKLAMSVEIDNICMLYQTPLLPLLTLYFLHVPMSQIAFPFLFLWKVGIPPKMPVETSPEESHDAK